MAQYFYLIGHDDLVGDDFKMDKVFLQEREAIVWGRKFATENNEYSVYLYKQEISRNGVIKFVKSLHPFSDHDIDTMYKI